MLGFDNFTTSVDFQGMPNSVKYDIEELIKATERNRIEMEKVWRKVEDLNAAIESVRKATEKKPKRLKSKSAR